MNTQYFKVANLIESFEFRNDFINKGYLYITNQKVDISRATNYFKVDHEICQFALCTRFEYELNNTDHDTENL